MRKIEQAMKAAIAAGKNWQAGNTRVESHGDARVVYLHGHRIAHRFDGVWRFTLAGWNTPTTRSRLNALGAFVYTRKGQAYHDAGVAITNDEWFTAAA